MSFEEEKKVLIDRFIDGLKHTIKELQRLNLMFTPEEDQKVVSSNSDLEHQIETAIFSFNAKETAFCCSLVSLYKKYNRPHPLALEDAIRDKEDELKAYLVKAKKEAEDLYKKIENSSIQPNLLMIYFDWSDSINFKVLTDKYKKLAKNPENAHHVENQLRAEIMGRLKEQIEKNRSEC